LGEGLATFFPEAAAFEVGKEGEEGGVVRGIAGGGGRNWWGQALRD